MTQTIQSLVMSYNTAYVDCEAGSQSLYYQHERLLQDAIQLQVMPPANLPDASTAVAVITDLDLCAKVRC